MSFYVTLPSNGADLTSEYGKSINTQTDFFINLNKTLDLSIADYEVALVEFMYPYNWIVKLCTMKIYQNGEELTSFDIYCKDGDFLNNLCSKINYNIERNSIRSNLHNKKLVTFVMNNEKNKICIHVEENSSLFIDGILTRYLQNKFTLPLTNLESIDSNDEIQKSSIFNSLMVYERDCINVQDDVMNIYGDKRFVTEFFISDPRILTTKELYIYTDIIEDQFVGDQKVKLLKIFTVKENEHRIISETVNLPHYLPINQNKIDRIHMKISDSQGNKINFSDPYSSVIYKLHFRVKRF